MRKKRYFGRFVMFLLCAVFAVAFLLPTAAGFAACALFTAAVRLLG